MRRGICRVLTLILIAGVFCAFGTVKDATAGVEVSVNIGPPPIVVAEPPEVVLMPGTGVYYVPQPEVDVFFYNGYWWSPRGPRWYRSRAYKGPWGIVHRRYVPVPVIRVPGDYRVAYGQGPRIPYGEWRGHWRHPERWDRPVPHGGPLPPHPPLPPGPGPHHIPLPPHP
jgi:hypothetical protein